MTVVSPERFSSLIQGAATITANSDLTALLFATAETARETTGARYAALGVIGEHSTLVEFHHVGFEPATAEAIGHLPVGRGVLGTLIRSAQTIRLDRLQDHPDSTGFPPNHPVMESFLGVPVRVGDRVFGNLYLTEKPGGFTEEDEDLVEALATIAGSAVANSRMQQRMRRLAVVEDRERIARELHDAIIQDIFAVGLLLQGLALRLEDERERREIEDAVGRLDEAITMLRRFIFDLRRPSEHGRDLVIELSRIVRQLSDPYGIEVKVTVADDLSDQRRELSGALIDDVCQIVREATSNALRHSGTPAIEVRVESGLGSLVITVVDQGRGFDPRTANEGMGLKNLRYRAEKAGGETTIHSHAEEGTAVRVVLPI
ncbi:MAG: GAF domain-containing protein [Actinobacteria bacterium]|nr:GAF domain-containing protein [Actinomycetota bacterium]